MVAYDEQEQGESEKNLEMFTVTQKAKVTLKAVKGGKQLSIFATNHR